VFAPVFFIKSNRAAGSIASQVAHFPDLEQENRIPGPLRNRFHPLSPPAA